MEKIKVFILLGRLSSGLGVSKTLPIASSEYVKQVFVFSNKAHVLHNKVTYVLLPEFLNESNIIKKVIRYFYEFFQILYFAIIHRPAIINGVFTYPKGYYAFIVSKILSLKCMISIIGNVNEIDAFIKYSNIIKKFNLFVYKNSDIITTKGNHISNHLLKEGIPKNKIFTFNGSINIENCKLRLMDYEYDLIYAGYFSDNKGPLRFVQIVKKISIDFRDIKAVMLGNGPLLDTVNRILVELNLTKNIQVMGNVNNVQDYYGKSKIFILPSISEGLSTAMLEAMSCGCIPVVSDVGSTNEAVISNYNGFLVDRYDDIDAYVYYCKLILQNGLLQEKFVIKGKEMVERNYSLKAQTILFDRIILNTNIIKGCTNI